MNKQGKIITTLGVIVVILPFLGIPFVWKQWIFFVLGLGMIVFGLALVMGKKHKIRQQNAAGDSRDTDTFVDTTTTPEPHEQ